MDTKTKTYLTAGALVAIIIGVLFALNGGTNQIEFPVATTTPSVEDATTNTATTSKSIPTPTQQTQKETTAGTTTNASETVPAPTPNVTLSVAGSLYSTFAPAGSTVLDTMRALTSTSNFTFTGHDYPSLGFFVDSINGKKAENSHNWMLYMNGKLSNTGASQTTLETGDAVEWKYEKSY